jgi:acetone carboxylase gamma subunit
MHFILSTNFILVSEISFFRKGVDITAQRRHSMKWNDKTESPEQRQLFPVKSDKKRLSGTSCDHSVYSEEEDSKLVSIYVKFRRQITDDPMHKH